MGRSVTRRKKRRAWVETGWAINLLRYGLREDRERERERENGVACWVTHNIIAAYGIDVCSS